MKLIDWKAVSSNSVLSKQFSLDVFNKFQSLSTSEINADNIEDVYNTLIESTEEVALATLPKKEKEPRINHQTCLLLMKLDIVLKPSP